MERTWRETIEGTTDQILAQIKVVADRWRPLLLEAASAVEGDAPKPQK